MNAHYYPIKKNRLLLKGLFFFFWMIQLVAAQNSPDAFRKGEFLKYKVSYGIMNAGYATLELHDTVFDGKRMHYAKGKGWSTGVLEFFFPVRDVYESVFDPENLRPYYFIRRVREGNYTNKKDIRFDYQRLEAHVIDLKNHTEKKFPIQPGINDMVSTYYFVRQMDINKLQPGEIVEVKMFYDNRTNILRLKYMGEDVINTKYGKLNTFMIKPMVEEGRIFSDQESVTLWFTNDKNKVLVRAKGDILVGSVKFEIEEMKHLSHPISIAF